MATNDDRRQFQRRSLSTTILFRRAESPGGNPFRSGEMRDISDGGVAFDTEDPPEDGSLIDMFFKEHAASADRRVRGRVVWTKAGQSGTFNIGVSFVA